MSDVSESLISLTKNEGPWAIRSGRSEEMSDVSESLILLTKNEQMSESLMFLSESLIRSFFDKKRAIHSEIKWAISQPWLSVRVGHRVLFCSERIILLRSFTLFFEFERKRMERTQRSFAKNVKELRECFVLLQRT